MKKNLISNAKNFGFTLIELLVVISIIALLSSIVLATLNSSRDKAGNSTVKAQLSNIRSQASLLCGDGSASCASVCLDGTINSMITYARTVGGGTGINTTIFCSTSAWMAVAKLKSVENGNAYWCVDSNGGSRGRNDVASGVGVCP